MVPEENQYLSFQGIRVHFSVCMPENDIRDRVLLLCSPLICTFHWRKLVPELTQSGCLVAMVDLPGFGRSDCRMHSPQDSIMRANIVWGILYEIDRQTGAPNAMWHLMGHGSACAALLEMAGLYPDSVKSQVHISPLITTPSLARSAPPDRWYRETIVAKDGFRSLIERCSGYPMDDYIVDRMHAPLIRQGARETFMHMLRAGRTAPECDLGFCPAMVIIGGRDVLMTDAVRAEIDRYLGAAETHILKSAGHFPMETHSKALRDYLRGWIRYNS